MSDVYAMNKETGEIIPCTQAIKLYYSNHGCMESWTDEWIETNLECNIELSMPDFTNVLK